MSFVSSTNDIVIKPNSGSSGSSGTITLDTNNSSGNGNIYLKSNGTSGGIHLDASGINVNGIATFDSSANFNVIPTSSSTQPLASDNSNKIPTTAWVQSAISTSAYSAYPALNSYSSGVQAVSTWTLRTAFDKTWSSICWSPELMLFVAVSYDTTGNIVMTSSNGITWTSRTSASSSQWKSVCWSGKLSLFVAVSDIGINNAVMTSTNGINWTLRSLTDIYNWSSICWSPELSLFVAVASGGAINTTRAMTSPDGINWTFQTTGSNNWRSVCWSPQLGIFVAVASTGTNRVITSSNGINWTSILVVSNSWEAVCWSPELRKFCAVSSSGTNRVMTSSDGINWNTYAASNAYSWLSVCWSPQLMLFVATTPLGAQTDKIMSSPDGMKWTTRTSPDIALQSICWSPELGIFAAVASTGISGNRVITSSLDARPPTSQNVFDSSSNNIDNNGNWDIKARNINLQNGLIQGRSDGLNYADDIYNKNVGYCLFSKLETAESFVNTTETVMTPPSTTLPAGVYMISGVITFGKGNAVYATANPFTVKWSAVNGIVPETADREIVASATAGSGLIIGLPTTYLIITSTSGGKVSPVYTFTITSGTGTTSTVNYEISIIRIA